MFLLCFYPGRQFRRYTQKKTPLKHAEMNKCKLHPNHLENGLKHLSPSFGLLRKIIRELVLSVISGCVMKKKNFAQMRQKNELVVHIIFIQKGRF